MADINNMKDLERMINAKIKETMGHEVFLETKDCLKEHIQKDVYNTYTPYNLSGTDHHYKRTGELINEGNIIGEVRDTSLMVETIAYDDNVIKTIETGKGYKWGKASGYVRDLDDEIGARPFIAKTQEEMNNGRFGKALKEGLKNKGLNVE